LSIWLPALLLPITWALDIQMAHARPFWTSTLQDLSDDIKNTPMWDVLTPAIELWVFGSPEGLQFLTFGSVGFTFTLSPKWGCDTQIESQCYILYIITTCVCVRACDGTVPRFNGLAEPARTVGFRKREPARIVGFRKREPRS
jgi:hypothetical protein